MRLLLDTHVVVWLAVQPDRVPEGVRDRVRAAEENVISAVSAYEVAYKTRIGKFPQGRFLVDAWTPVRTSLRACELGISADHMLRAGTLAWAHRDPFDRRLVAQAQMEALTLVTADESIRAYCDVRTIWA